MITFDECFQTYPPIDPPADLEQFWKDSLRELKSVPIKEDIHAPLKGRHIKETVYNVSFQSINNYRIHGTLVIPRKRGDLPVIVYFHDYNDHKPKFSEELTEIGLAQLIIDIRGHGKELIRPVFAPEDKKAEEEWSPGYFIQGIENKETFFQKYLYLDVIRSIDFLRLTNGIDGNRIYLHGKNLGAAMALFGAAYSNRVRGLILETPSFCYLTDEQLKMNSYWAKEIREYMNLLTPPKKTRIRKNISYFDTLNFAHSVNLPVLFSCGLKDIVSSPKSIFALFNHMNGDKRMEVYPDQGNNAGAKIQAVKNIAFLKEIV